MSKVLDSMWWEKYRPMCLDDLILPDSRREVFATMISKREMPNLLFHGPQGGGKSTLARILMSKKYGLINDKQSNVLEINGSSKRTRGIGFMDDVVDAFLRHPPIGSDIYKVVFIDEADKLTKDAFDSLRGLIEKYGRKYGRFLFTGNWISKIPGPVQSRFMIFPFEQIPKVFVTDYCVKVLESENIKFEKENAEVVVEALYPDVRGIMNTIQKGSYTGELKINKDDITTLENTLIGFVLEVIDALDQNQLGKLGKPMDAIFTLLKDNDIDFPKVYERLFFKKVSAPIKIIINEFSSQHQTALNPVMNFTAMIFKFMKAMGEYHELRSK